MSKKEIPMRLLGLACIMVLGGVLGGVLGSLSAVALGSDQVIGQNGRKFSIDGVTVKKGIALTFLNDDSVPHNVVSTSKGNEFDLGSQLPGTSTDVTFTAAGEVSVICAIHPRMKMVVTVIN
jgi:plastocyanin